MSNRALIAGSLLAATGLSVAGGLAVLHFPIATLIAPAVTAASGVAVTLAPLAPHGVFFVGEAIGSQALKIVMRRPSISGPALTDQAWRLMVLQAVDASLDTFVDAARRRTVPVSVQAAKTLRKKARPLVREMHREVRETPHMVHSARPSALNLYGLARDLPQDVNNAALRIRAAEQVLRGLGSECSGDAFDTFRTSMIMADAGPWWRLVTEAWRKAMQSSTLHDAVVGELTQDRYLLGGQH